jgi:hypothetical protein
MQFSRDVYTRKHNPIVHRSILGWWDSSTNISKESRSVVVMKICTVSSKAVTVLELPGCSRFTTYVHGEGFICEFWGSHSGIILDAVFFELRKWFQETPWASGWGTTYPALQRRVAKDQKPIFSSISTGSFNKVFNSSIDLAFEWLENIKLKWYGINQQWYNLGYCIRICIRGPQVLNSAFLTVIRTTFGRRILRISINVNQRTVSFRFSWDTLKTHNNIKLKIVSQARPIHKL